MLARVAAAGTRRVDGHSPGVARPRARRLPRGGRRVRPREHRARGGRREAPQGHVGLHPAGLREPEPRDARARRSSATARSSRAFCTDDREPDTLLGARARQRLRPPRRRRRRVRDRRAAARQHATRPATTASSTWGALGPGHQADVLCFDRLGAWQPARVWQAGRLVAEGGPSSPARSRRGAVARARCATSVHLGALPAAARARPRHPAGAGASARSASRAGSLTTRAAASSTLGADRASTSPARRCVERHHASGRIGLGYVSGFGLRRGAIASTVAHDAHNCMVVGARDAGRDMAVAVARLAEIGGGQVAVLDGARAGRGAAAARRADERPAGRRGRRAAAASLGAAAADALGIDDRGSRSCSSPSSALSVIPELRLTDGGLVDVDAFAHVARRGRLSPP